MQKICEETTWGTMITRYLCVLWIVRLEISYRSGGSLGRFGGGWNWSVGVKLGGRTLLFDLLMCTISVTLLPFKW